MAQFTLQKYDCDRCGITYSKAKLKRQRGMLLCCDCYDNLKKLERPNPRWLSPRDNSTTTTAVNTPTIFQIGAATGITSLGWSRDYAQDGRHLHYYMQIEGSGGSVTVTASPQIIAGQENDVLTLRGNSNTNTVTFTDGRGVALNANKPITLTEGDTITLVYYPTFAPNLMYWGESPWSTTGWGENTIGAWVEMSRLKGGI